MDAPFFEALSEKYGIEQNRLRSSLLWCHDFLLFMVFLRHCQYRRLCTIRVKMNYELERICKKPVVVTCKYYPGICLEIMRETTKRKTRIAGVPTRVRTEHLSKRNLRALQLLHPAWSYFCWSLR
jgi:hypothetical protein